MAPVVPVVLGLPLSSLFFALSVVVCSMTSVLTWRAARAAPQRTTAWRAHTVSNALGAVASALAIATALSGSGALAAFYLGSAASLGLIIGCGAFARDAWRTARPVDAVDPLVMLGVLAAIVLDVVVIPAARGGDPLLAGVVVADLFAFSCVALATIGTLPRLAKIAFCVALLGVVCGDSLAAAASADLVGAGPALVALLWAASSACGAVAALAEIRRPVPGPAAREPRHDTLRAWGRVLLPLGVMAALPAACVVHALDEGHVSVSTVIYYGIWGAVTAAVAFTRQAHLLLENRRAVARERALRADAQRRAAELEALTGLATAMTEVPQEAPMVERGLDALGRAGRTSAAAVHLVGEDGELHATGAWGAWATESVWASVRLVEGPAAERCATRELARLPLVSRDTVLGVLTLVRPVAEGPFGPELDFLRVLADQLALAVRNARDHRATLESAIRDPLTGLYNSRFFFEAFEKEVRRHERYGTSASFVLFDVDDFKAVNDSLGHEAADQVLRRIAEIIEPHIRPSDSLARVGGEEFALLLPETGQMDALLAAERVRTAISRQSILPDRQVTVSGGVASMPHDGTTREELTRRADAAMRWAKRNGKNLCAVAREMEDEASPEITEGMLAHLHAVVSGIDSAHLHTRDHSENVAAYAVAIAQALGLDPERIVRLRRAAFLHDIGKIAVPDVVLSKPDRLTDAEFTQIKVHPEVGGHMLQHAGLHAEAGWVRHHHERVDGGGYPDGISGDALALESRIIFVADSFEAMTSDRPYSRGKEVVDAIAELRRCAGTQFDPRVVEVMCELLENDRLAVLALRDADFA